MASCLKMPIVGDIFKDFALFIYRRDSLFLASLSYIKLVAFASKM